MKKILMISIVIASSISSAQAKEVQQNMNCQPDSPVKYCIACHGAQGLMTNNEMPKIQRMPKKYIKEQLLAFKSGKRVSSEMNALMPYITENQIEQLAEYYSSIGRISKGKGQ